MRRAEAASQISDSGASRFGRGKANVNVRFGSADPGKRPLWGPHLHPALTSTLLPMTPSPFSPTAFCHTSSVVLTSTCYDAVCLKLPLRSA